ncbi:MAG: hypothetical protein KUG60_03180, partial [Gammaproteobacteria bacterium]|nr:hypothetical protein [Gammaproteobacteria bacterium]
MKFTKLPLSIAIATAMGVSAAYAEDSMQGGTDDNVSINKNINVSQNTSINGEILSLGLIMVDSSAMAVSDLVQDSNNNQVTNGPDSTNSALVDGNALDSASGNIGLNVAAGDNNIQQNSTSIATAESEGITATFHADLSESAATGWNNEGSSSSSESESASSASSSSENAAA